MELSGLAVQHADDGYSKCSIHLFIQLFEVTFNVTVSVTCIV